ncbi:MAG: T9SS type A sorting domain-containing protein [Ignavibacteriae bacterium]|nr:T9SS type A sorting domain-containing protein [Ignavibacteriota bacterium]
MKGKIFTSAAFLILIFSQHFYAANNETKKTLNKRNYTPKYAQFNINNISTFIYNNGKTDIDPNGNSGLVYPKGSNKTVMFQSGFLWGAKINGKVQVGGSTYTQGLLGGRILENGAAQNPDEESVRVYRVRPDYKSGDLSVESSDENKSIQEIYNQYKKDWNEWPAKFGAPYFDTDNDGIYNPEVDVPGVPGAAQTLWYVANDLDSNVAKELYGSTTMGVEMQVTVWGYKDFQTLDNMLFKKYVLINKSQNTFEDTYLSIWCDPDVGDASDDYVGCDTTLSLAYAYNGFESDYVYGKNTPTIGFKFLQGPIVEGASSDKAYFNGELISGKKNLPMTSFIRLLKNYGTGFDDAWLGNYEGTLDTYNFQKGFDSFGNDFFDPINNNVTKFSVPGDPVQKTGWFEGVDKYGPADRRFIISSGPFTMAPGDTQEVIIAQIAAGGDVETDRLEAVTLLKSYTNLAQEFYDFNFYGDNFSSLVPPKVKAIELDEEIVLTWFDDENISKIESQENSKFKFQGYTIYQFPNDRYHQYEAKEIATYDIIDGIKKITTPILDFDGNTESPIKVVKLGSDSGIKRHISIKKNYLNPETQLNNGTKYYFGISAYFLYNNFSLLPQVVETEYFGITATPQLPKPGNSYEGKYGDYLEVIRDYHNLYFNVIIIDPTKLKAGEYKIELNNSATWKNLTWSLLNSNESTILVNQKVVVKDSLGIVVPNYVYGLEITPEVFDTTKTPPTKSDIFTFISPGAVIGNTEIAKQQVDEINVFPNPYYGTQVNEVHQFDKFVTFNHLPNNARLRIFNLAGQLIKKIEKNDESQFLEWNLTNNKNFWIASGIYIVYIEMPELNKTKILKLAVVMENVVQDFF